MLYSTSKASSMTPAFICNIFVDWGLASDPDLVQNSYAVSQPTFLQLVISESKK